MRLYRLTKAGSIEALTICDAPEPRPLRRQVLVRMRAAALNYRDLAVALGRYGLRPVPDDLVPLSDGAGEVVECGEGVTRVKSGDRVAGIFMQSWQGGDIEPRHWATALGGSIDGVLTEYRVFEEDGLVQLPPHLTYEEGCTLPCAAVTAWHALYGPRPLRLGESVLTLGTGGVSMFAVQFAHAAGARVIATSSSGEKLKKALAAGAEGVNYTDHPEWEQEIRRLTSGRGVDHVIEVGGPGTLPRSVAATRAGGSVHLIGVLTQGEINPLGILGSSITVRGVAVGSRMMFEEMNEAIAVQRLHPIIDHVFPFSDARQAYHHLQRAGHVGKVVINIA